MQFEGEFRGRRVLVTGASGIVGSRIAAAFSREGAELWLTDRDENALARQCRELDGPARYSSADLCREAEILALAQAVEAAWGAPHILINNAGVYPSASLLDTSLNEWDRILGVNLRAPFFLTRLMAAAMIREGVEGAVVNISSGAANRLRADGVPYCVSKVALDKLTKGFALELAPYRIRVNAVEPGFASGSKASPLSEDYVRAMRGRIPMGRESGPDDAPMAVLYLCSRAASYITGATLAVDGGNACGIRIIPPPAAKESS